MLTNVLTKEQYSDILDFVAITRCLFYIALAFIGISFLKELMAFN